MANTYTSLHYHIVFSTKNREPFLETPIRLRLFPYLAGIAKDHGVRAIEIGGIEDHVHLLLAIPPSAPVSRTVQLLKGGSSHWLKDAFPTMAAFAWQDGYGAFTVSKSQLKVVRRYIQEQEEHHRTQPFAEEYRSFLLRHGVSFNERFLLG
jgi:REP element-mobilizing transposase RayT